MFYNNHFNSNPNLKFLFLIAMVVFCVGLFAVNVGTASAIEYYIAPDGSNSNNGLSLIQAWATLDHADDYVKNPGDILYIAEGE